VAGRARPVGRGWPGMQGNHSARASARVRASGRRQACTPAHLGHQMVSHLAPPLTQCHLPHPACPAPRRRMAVHMDCLHWVNRDSYLPQGSRGLKVGKCEGWE